MFVPKRIYFSKKQEDGSAYHTEFQTSLMETLHFWKMQSASQFIYRIESLEG